MLRGHVLYTHSPLRLKGQERTLHKIEAIVFASFYLI